MKIPLDLAYAKKLPEGIIREPELKNISDIFSEDNLTIAIEIVNTVGHSDRIAYPTKASILEEAFKYGFLATEKVIQPKPRSTNTRIKQPRDPIWVIGLIVQGILVPLVLLFKLAENYYLTTNKINKEIRTTLLESLSPFSKLLSLLLIIISFAMLIGTIYIIINEFKPENKKSAKDTTP